MQKVFIMNFKDDKQADEFIDRVFANRDVGITVETFNTTLEAFAHQEGPYRVGQLIENNEMEKPDDEKLLELMSKEATHRISENLHDDNDDDYCPILDYDVLDEIATDSAIKIFREHMEELNEHDRTIAEKYIEEWA